jgi:hypothetical protein
MMINCGGGVVAGCHCSEPVGAAHSQASKTTLKLAAPDAILFGIDHMQF